MRRRERAGMDATKGPVRRPLFLFLPAPAEAAFTDITRAASARATNR
jgi:hypothetical protein